jgi:hypothetical protein
MRVAEYPLAQLHWAIRQDPWVRAIFLAAGVPLDTLAERILDLASFEDSEAMLSRSLALWERILGLTPGKDASTDERRRAVRAMWLACLPPSIQTIQAVCDNWRAGEIEASYDADIGTIVLTYLGAYGAQAVEDSLVRALDTVKPAHLALDHAWRYRLVKDLHRQVSVAELETIPLGHFAGGTGTTDRTRGSGLLQFGDVLIVRQRSRISVRDDGEVLHITDSPSYRYEAPDYEQIGDGLWEIEDALTVAADSRISVRDDGTTLHITYKED